MSRINVLSFLCVSFALLLVVSAFETSTHTKDEKKSDTKVAGIVEDLKSGGQGKCGGTCGGGGAGNGGAGGHGGPGGNGGKGGGSGNGGPGGNGRNGGSGGNGGKGSGCGHQCCDSGGGCKKCCAAGYNVYVVAEDAETATLASNNVAPSVKGGRCKEYCCKWRGGYCAKKCYRCLDKNGVWTEVQESDVQQLGTNYDNAVGTTNSKDGGGK